MVDQYLHRLTGYLRDTVANRRQADSGQVLILFAMSIFVLIGFLALSIDVGYALAERRQAQAAVDAASMAADKAYQRNELADIETTARAYAIANGFDASEVQVEVLPSYTPSGRGTHEMCVRTTITHDVTPFFVAAVYAGDWKVAAVGVACTDLQPRPYAILALDEDGDGITAGGTSNILIDSGGAMSNSRGAFAGTVDWLQVEGPLDAYDGISIDGSANVVASTFNGTAPSVADPLASVPEPTMAQCGANRPNPNIGPSSPSVTVLQPGNYTNGVTASGTGNKSIVLAPGVYCFGRDFSVNSGSSSPKLVYGQDVLLYFYNGAELVIRGGATGFYVSHEALPAGILSSAASGVTAALASNTSTSCAIDACVAEIVIFYSRANCDDLRIEGGNGMNITGIVYAPCSEMHLAGHSGSRISGQVIAGELDFLGTSDLTIIYDVNDDMYVPLVYLVD